MDIPQLPVLAHYTSKDVRDILFELDVHKRYAIKLEKYIADMQAIVLQAGIKLPEGDIYASEEGQQQENSIGQYQDGNKSG